MKKIKNFFKDVKKEVSKVKWPTKKDMFKYSLTVILFIVFFALFFLGCSAEQKPESMDNALSLDF